MKPKIGIFGAGWVGLVTGACFAELGHEVVIRDVAAASGSRRCRQAGVPLHEPGLAELLERNRERLTFTLDVAEIVTAPSDVRLRRHAADLLRRRRPLGRLDGRRPAARRSRSGAILVMKSTVPVGTGEKVRAALDARGLAHVGYVSNPEFLSEGSAVRDFMKPDRVVVGAFTEADAAGSLALYEPLEAPVVRTDVASAEMIKLAANAFLMTRISFINEIANVCEATGADVVKVAEGVGLDHRLGPHFLRAGIGWGGSCFPKDGVALKQLASNSGYHFQLLAAVIEVNELQKRRVDREAREAPRQAARARRSRCSGSRSSRTRTTARGAVARAGLAPAGRGRRRARVGPGRRRRAGSCRASPSATPSLDAVTGADAAVIVTEWDELRGLASDDVRQAMRRPLIVDGRNLLDPEEARSAGFTYEGIGRAASPLAALPETEEPAAQRDRPVVEAIILAGGKAERLGEAAGGRPKALVEVGGRPLAAYQVEQLARPASTACSSAAPPGRRRCSSAALGGIGPEIVAVPEPEPLGRGGGIRFAARQRREPGDAVRAQRRRARRRRPDAAARTPPRRRRGRDDHGRAAAVAVRRGRARRRGSRDRLPGGAAA